MLFFNIKASRRCPIPELLASNDVNHHHGNAGTSIMRAMLRPTNDK